MSQCEEANPRPNPSVESNPENILYEAWRVAEEWQRPEIEVQLLQLLKRHASKVCWMVLHSNQTDFIDQIAQDAILKMSGFQGRSAFSTWFHTNALNFCRTKRTQNNQRKEVPLDNVRWDGISAGLETRVIVQEMLSKLTDVERRLIELKVDEGLTDEEVAAQLGFTHEWVQKLWSRLRKRLKEEYGSRKVR